MILCFSVEEREPSVKRNDMEGGWRERKGERERRAREKDGMDRAHPDPRTFFSTPGAKSDKSNLTDGIAAIHGGRE